MSNIIITLDAGHGAGRSHNRGFVGGGTYDNEGDNNWFFTKKLKDELLKYRGITVLETRPNRNSNPSLSYRASVGGNSHLFLSIHSNAGGGTGTEVFDSVTRPNRTLASRLTNTTSSTLGLRNRGVKYKRYGNINWYGVLRGRQRSSMLLEMFFHDNRNDVQKFKANQDRLVVNLASSIASYYGKTLRKGVNISGQQGGMTMLGRKPVAIISILSEGDYKGAEVIRDWLYPSYNPIITQSGKFNYAGINTNYIIAVGGTKGNHTGYANYLVSGKNRQETYDKCLEFVNGGSKGREKFKI